MKKIITMIFALALALSCTERVELPQHDTPPHLQGTENEEQEQPEEEKPEEEKPEEEKPSEGTSMTVRLCSYNVGTFNKYKTELGHYSYPEAAVVLNSIDADIVGLNETDKGNNRTENHYQAEELAKQLGEGWTYYFAYAHNTAYGNGIVASGEFKVVKEWPRLMIPKEDGGEIRSMGAVEYEEFVFCVAHLDHLSATARKNGATLISNWALENYGKGKTTKPVFLVGDMNCIPADAPITVFKENWKMISANEKTFSKGTCIDYIFALDNGVEYTVGESHSVTSCDLVDISLISDHFPVYCDVTFTVK